MRNVQIPYDLFTALLKYHLLQDYSFESEIHQGLNEKLEAMVKRESYAKGLLSLHYDKQRRNAAVKNGEENDKGTV